MKRKPEPITVHLRGATRRIDEAANIVCDGMIACIVSAFSHSRAVTLATFENFFPDPIALSHSKIGPL
jgi:hypothetical protein